MIRQYIDDGVFSKIYIPKQSSEFYCTVSCMGRNKQTFLSKFLNNWSDDGLQYQLVEFTLMYILDLKVKINTGLQENERAIICNEEGRVTEGCLPALPLKFHKPCCAPLQICLVPHRTQAFSLQVRSHFDAPYIPGM